MSGTLIQGLPGDGKSYWAVNTLILGLLATSKRQVFANLPINRPELEASLARVVGRRRAAEGMGRLVLTSEKWPDEEQRFRGEREFWKHCKRGSVVVLDEAASLWRAKETVPASLGDFINHHRHYLIDFYLFAQDIGDIHHLVRNKIEAVVCSENCLGRPIAPQWWFMAWLIWPVTWFRVRQFAVRRVGTQLKIEQTPTDLWNVWASRRGFGTYRSFERARGVVVGGDDGEVSQAEIDLVEKEKRAALIRRAWRNLAFASVLAISVGYGGYTTARTYWSALKAHENKPLAGGPSGPAVQQFGGGTNQPAGGTVTESGGGDPGGSGGSNLRSPGGSGPVAVFIGRRVRYERNQPDVGTSGPAVHGGAVHKLGGGDLGKWLGGGGRGGPIGGIRAAGDLGARAVVP